MIPFVIPPPQAGSRPPSLSRDGSAHIPAWLPLADWPRTPIAVRKYKPDCFTIGVNRKAESRERQDVLFTTSCDQSYGNDSDQRPSRHQSAAKAPTSKARPRRPPNRGSRSTLFSTVASGRRSPIQPSPEADTPARTVSRRGSAAASPSRVDAPPLAWANGARRSVVLITS